MNNLSFEYKGQIFETGDRVSCVIHRKKIDNARIYIEEDSLYEKLVCYICQDLVAGRECIKKFGYLYSWAIFVENIINEDILHTGFNNFKKEISDELVSSITNIIGG